MPIVLALQTLVTLTAAIHIYRTGRPNWWIFVVFAFPLLGALAYIFMEVLPASREGVQLARGLRALRRKMDPTRDFRERAEDAERCGSVANRIELARECIDLGHYAQAVSLLKSCLTGQFAGDLEIRHLLAVAHFGNEEFSEAIEAAGGVIKNNEWYQSGGTILLLANAYAAAGRTGEANAAFRSVVDRFAGEEARSDFIRFLARDGRIADARELIEEMRRRVRLNGRTYERRNHEWIAAAETAVAAAGG